MLPKETSIRQLKMLRKLSKGTDIGDITTKDRLNKDIPNMQSIANPVDTGVESWEDFSKKDSKLQTIAFKSKLVNKPIVKENKKNIMKEDIIKFNDFENEKINESETSKEIIEDKPKNDELEFEKIQTFDSYTVNEKKKSKKVKEEKEEQPEYTMLGKEKEPKSNPNFGIGAVKASEIKKITDLNIIDPPTPKERPILNAGQFINNGVVNGQINRIEGKDVFVESAEEPGVINKHTINDILKIKEEE